jgi:hypothetical protein
MAVGPIDVVLFDLGGVLVDFGGVAPMKELARIEDDDELWRRWLTCPWVRTFERGGCSPEDFAAGVVREWDLPVAPEDFLATAAEPVRRRRPTRLSSGPVACLVRSRALIARTVTRRRA